MEHILAGLLTIFAMLTHPHSVQAASCSYGNTQARVQNSITVPWAPSITVGCEKTFNVGSFHNGTGQFAGDTSLLVTGPGNFTGYFRNGDTVRVQHPGTYTLNVTTNNQDGPACSETATVNVVCPNTPPPPTPTPIPAGQCQYRDTQARVQNSIRTPWSQAIRVGCEKTFNVGSFHNGTGQFAGDTTAVVTGPNGFYRTVRNGETVTAGINGIYVLQVNTNGQSGFGCSETASVSVQCVTTKPTPTPTPTPWISPPPVAPGSCAYRDTQARIQRDEQQSWVSSLGVQCGETFRVGSFHNGTGQFASDTTLHISGPFGLNTNVSNAETIRALLPGWYILSVTTNGQSGAGCQESAFVFAGCANWWKR